MDAQGMLAQSQGTLHMHSGGACMDAQGIAHPRDDIFVT
jgi:hypothetical protein